MINKNGKKKLIKQKTLGSKKVKIVSEENNGQRTLHRYMENVDEKGLDDFNS